MLRNLVLAAAAATITTVGMASAADLPSKKSVPTLAAAEPSAIHGFMDFGYASSRVTGGGLPLYPSSSVILQADTGLSIDLYSSKSGFINSVSAFVGAWAESWNDAPSGTRNMQEYDWWAGGSIGFADHFKFTAQSLQFQLPGSGVVKNATASLAFDDAYLGLPIALNPSVSVIYNFTGGLTLMPLGKTDTYRVDLAIAPGYSFLKSSGIPLSVSVPTSVSLGPTNDYYLASYKGCGSASAVKGSGSACSTNTFEMFSTGLQAKYDLGQIIPKKFGSWSAKAGVQYYQFLSDALKANQGGTMASRKSNFTVFSTGIGVSF